MSHTNLTASDTVHELLFQALIEIRSHGYESKDKLVYYLADLFHNAVFDLKRAADGQMEYDEILARLEERAVENGCERWISSNITRLEERAKTTSTMSNLEMDLKE